MPFVRFNAKMSGTKSMCPTLAWLDFNIISQDLTPFFCLPTKAVGRKALPTLRSYQPQIPRRDNTIKLPVIQ